MCQAYEGERAGIVASENRATISGFAAAHTNKPKSTNPYNQYNILFGYERDAWDHGWDCYQTTEGGRILPYALEAVFLQKGEYEKAQKART